MKTITRIGVGGPVGSGKTALIEAVTPLLVDLGVRILVITNDIVTTEDAKHVQRTLKGVLIEDRILGVETGACPHTAVREDPSMNLAAVEDMEARFPDTDLVFIESGGDNLTLTFSPALVDYFIYVIDVAAGDKDPPQKRSGHHPVGHPGHQQDRSGSLRRRRPGGDAAGFAADARRQALPADQLQDRRRHPGTGAVDPGERLVRPSFGERRLMTTPHVFPELAPYQDEPKQLPTGSPGKVAELRMAFKRRGVRTILSDLYRRAP